MVMTFNSNPFTPYDPCRIKQKKFTVLLSNEANRETNASLKKNWVFHGSEHMCGGT
jgi:hypothetical protein